MEDLEKFIEGLPEIKFIEPKEWTDLECFMIFGMCGYYLTPGNVRVIQPYTKEFNALFCNDSMDSSMNYKELSVEDTIKIYNECLTEEEINKLLNK